MSNLLQVPVTDIVTSQFCRSGTVVVNFAKKICVAVLFLSLTLSMLMSEEFIEPEWKSGFRRIFKS